MVGHSNHSIYTNRDQHCLFFHTFLSRIVNIQNDIVRTRRTNPISHLSHARQSFHSSVRQGTLHLQFCFEGSESSLDLVRACRLVQQPSILFQHSGEGVEHKPLGFKFLLELPECQEGVNRTILSRQILERTLHSPHCSVSPERRLDSFLPSPSHRSSSPGQ